MPETVERYPRKKATIIRSGIDPDMKRLNRLHAIRSNQLKKLRAAEDAYNRACASVEHYWEQVFDAVDEQEKAQAS